MKRKILCCLILLFSFFVYSKDNNLFSYETNDTIVQEGEPHYLVALTGSFLPSAVCYSWNNFILQAGWAKVDSDEMSTFYNRDLCFDGDWVSTNFLGHPYQGSLYYMVSRSSNLNPFESFWVSVLGSYIWEFLCEANAPSINDMAYTTFGAFALGEMLYRLSYEAGSVWFPLEYFINPMQLYARPFVKDQNKIPSGNIYEFTLYSGFGFGIGKDTFSTDKYNDINERYLFPLEMGLDVVYKDPYGHESLAAYDQFQMTLFGGIGPENGVSQEKPLEEIVTYNTTLLSDGVLKTYAPEIKENIDTTIGFTMLYDYTWQNFYEFCSLAPAIAIKQRFNNDNWSFAYQCQLGYNILGITEFNYYRRNLITDIDFWRSFNYVTGLEGANKLEWKYGKNTLTFNQRYFISRAFYDVKEDNFTGWDFYTLMKLNYEYSFTKMISMVFENDIYLKYSVLDDLPNYFTCYYNGNIFVKFNLKK